MVGDPEKTRRRLAAAAALAALWAAPALAQIPAELESVELQVEGTATYLSAVASSELVWTARADGLRLELRLPDCRPAPGLANLDLAGGLIRAVTVVTESSAPRPTTLIVVETSEATRHQVERRGRVLVVRFRPALQRRPPPASPAAPSRPPAAAPPTEDRIGLRDALAVEVFGLPELDRNHLRVLGDGTISLSLLGNVKVAGLTISEAERVLERLLSERRLARNPRVSIFIEEHISNSVSVQGAVRTPGFYPLQGRKSLFEMLVEAGGLDERAGGTIVVLRHHGGGGDERFEIDAERLIHEGDVDVNMELVPGDVVTVPHRRTFRVYVNGAVHRPGPVEFSSSEGITLLQAITAAGGTTERANAGKVHVLRRNPDGTQERIPVPLKKIKKGKEADLPLHRNDVVVVGEWFL